MVKQLNNWAREGRLVANQKVTDSDFYLAMQKAVELNASDSAFMGQLTRAGPNVIGKNSI